MQGKVLETSHDAILFQSWRLKIRMSNVSVTSTSTTKNLGFFCTPISATIFFRKKRNVRNVHFPSFYQGLER